MQISTTDALLLVTAAVLLPVLLYFERSGDRRGLVPAKLALSALFVAVGMVQPDTVPGYGGIVLAGLTFSLLGDLFLALQGRRAFLAGLVAFLIGHIWYVFAFASVADVAPWAFVGWLLIGAVSGAVYAWLKPHLGSLRRAVIAYVVVISLMVAAAMGVAGNPDWSLAGRAMVLVGALMFYLSDLFVAKDRFMGRDFANRRIGLPLYYGGQFLIALSIGALG